VVDRVIEAQRAVLDECHRTRGDDRLRHRAHTTDRVARHRRPRPGTLEREKARCFDVHLAVTGEDSHYTRDQAGIDVTLEQPSQPSQPFRREPTSSHLSPPHLVRSRVTYCATTARNPRTSRKKSPSESYCSSANQCASARCL